MRPRFLSDPRAVEGAERAGIRFRIVRDDDSEGAARDAECNAILAEYERARFGRASAAQLRFNAAAVRSVLGSAGLRDPRNIRAAHLEDWLAALARGGMSPKTLRNHIGGAGAVLTWMRRRGHIDHNPARDIDLPAVEDPPHIYLSESERATALRLAEAAGIGPEVTLALYGGLRMSELRRLRWRDVDLDGKALMVLGAKGRNGKRKWRRLWLHSRCIAALRAHRDRRFGRLTVPSAAEGGPGTGEWVFPGGRLRKSGADGGGTWTQDQPRGRDKWLGLLKPLQDPMPIFQSLPKGSTGRGWHLLRHTYASLALQHGVEMKKISQWLGHSSIVTTERHYAWLADRYDPDIEKL